MKRSIVEHIENILHEIEFISIEMKDVLREQFKNNSHSGEALTTLIIKKIELIGETSDKLKKEYPEFIKKYPEVPWTEIKATRNIYTHNFYDIDYNRVYHIAKEELPVLQKQITRIYQQEKGLSPRKDKPLDPDDSGMHL